MLCPHPPLYKYMQSPPFSYIFCADLSIYHQSIWHFEIIDLRQVHLLSDIIADLDWEELETLACLKK